MATHSTVSIYDDFTSSKTRVSVRTTNYEFSCWIDKVFYVVIQKSCWFENRFNNFFDDCLFDCVVIYIRIVLVRNNNSINADRFIAVIFNSYLRLCIRTEPGNFTRVAQFMSLQKNLMSIINRGWHERRSLVAGKTEHHTLVAGTLLAFIFIKTFSYNTLINICRLGVKSVHKKTVCSIKTYFRRIVADIERNTTGNFFYIAIKFFDIYILFLEADFTAYEQKVSR